MHISLVSLAFCTTCHSNQLLQPWFLMLRLRFHSAINTVKAAKNEKTKNKVLQPSQVLCPFTNCQTNQSCRQFLSTPWENNVRLEKYFFRWKFYYWLECKHYAEYNIFNIKLVIKFYKHCKVKKKICLIPISLHRRDFNHIRELFSKNVLFLQQQYIHPISNQQTVLQNKPLDSSDCSL